MDKKVISDSKEAKAAPAKVTQPVVKSAVPTKVTQPVSKAPIPVQIVVKPVPVKTEAEHIWEDIKNVKLDVFGLPNQLVSKYYKPFFIEPSKLYLTAETKASAVFPALEEKLQPKYCVELAERFILVFLNKKV